MNTVPVEVGRKRAAAALQNGDIWEEDVIIERENNEEGKHAKITRTTEFTEEEVNYLVDVYIDSRHEYHGKMKSASKCGMSKQVCVQNLSRNVS